MPPAIGSSPTSSGAHPLSVQIRIHQLNDDENLETVLFRIKKGWIVQFKLGPSLFGRRVKLFTNYPENLETGFSRTEYRVLNWKSESINAGDDTALTAEVTFDLAGTFHYFLVHDESTDDKPNGSGFILVEPHLFYGPDNAILPLDSILCQTYLAKCLGPFPEWEGRLRAAKETGYNMLHITPIQELGDSMSAYSLRNQLNTNPMFNGPSGKTCNLADIASLIEKMRVEWNVLSITDIVLNHTANESDWLKEHPEGTFNLANSPHLKPAYLLDRALWYLTVEVGDGKWTNSGLPVIISDESHLQAVRDIMYGVFLCQTKLHEFFMVDIDALVAQFQKILQDSPTTSKPKSEEQSLKIIPDPDYRRFKNTVNLESAVCLYGNNCNGQDAAQVKACCNDFRRKLEQLNADAKRETENHLSSALDNVTKGIRYQRLDWNGPRYGAVTKERPLVPQYFYQFAPDQNVAADEELMYTDDAKYIMAHNGWVMGDNPLKNFADSDSNVYLRRELIAWGDSVKLNYGMEPSDSPYLWEHMSKYVQDMARTFHGLRLDNCHSTPIHVAEYLIDKAREVRPDLYVIAELFTASEAIDNIFVNRLGITSLVREAMSAPDAHEQGRLVYRYGGSTVGGFMHPITRPLTISVAHAIFLDVTHDNPSPIQTRSVYDLFPTAAMVNMACCAAGSTRGFDELVPHMIDVVEESRYYSTWTDDPNPKLGYINSNSGIIAGKRIINELHKLLGSGGYTQTYVDQRDADTVAVTRHCPATHQSVILMARTAFSAPVNPMETGYIPPLTIPGIIEEILFEGYLEPLGVVTHKKDSSIINGLTDYRLVVQENIQLHDSNMVETTDVSEKGTQLDFTNFPRGSVIAFRVELESASRAAILRVRTKISQFGYRMRSYSGHLLERKGSDFECIISRMNLADINRVLFRCHTEERDESGDCGTYSIPNYGQLLYCGLQGVMSELMTIRMNDDLGHPLCDNLRNGDWLPNYITERLLSHPNTRDLGQWFGSVFQNLAVIPRYLIPCYFDTIITGAYSSVLSALWRKMSDFVNDGSTFVKALALASVALGGVVHSSPLPELSPNLELPLPPTMQGADGKERQCCVTISAGLPHFSVGYARNWGRDTFIALRGLLLIPGRIQEARFIILAFAGCLRHGLIPNLLDRGVNARFNCRDAVWWWLQSIQDYTKMVKNGHNILKDKVSRIFPTDDSEPQKPGKVDQLLTDVMQEALQKHFQGLKFRERNAGSRIDSQMKDNGFNNEIGVNLETGFVFGGNSDNCGTWMDKMGSSAKAGNKGVPATPRDGSAIELVGLSMSALRWLDDLFQKGIYPYGMVECVTDNEDGTRKCVIMSFKEWADLIKANFEKHFWVDPKPSPDDNKHINKRGIYKDSHGASTPWTDFQLRPNLCIAMVVAPELFTPERAFTALRMVEKHLLGPLGMKTLDPSDWQYDGNYVNSDDSTNKNKACGFNYHQGPEWLWPVGYFLRAKLHFAAALGAEEFRSSVRFVKHTISNHFQEVQVNKWKGLPELTNKDGAPCPDGCPIQAWSHGCLLEVLYDLDKKTSAKTSETS